MCQIVSFVYCITLLNQDMSKALMKERLGVVAQSVECLTADPGAASSTLARSNTFVVIVHEIISTVILLLPLV